MNEVTAESTEIAENAAANDLTGAVISAAIDAHPALGLGLLESTYEMCFCHELMLRGVPFERQKSIPVECKGAKLDCGYRADLLVDRTLLVEVKFVEVLAPIHDAQLLTYLKLGGWNTALMINFNVRLLK